MDHNEAHELSHRATGNLEPPEAGEKLRPVLVEALESLEREPTAHYVAMTPPRDAATVYALYESGLYVITATVDPRTVRLEWTDLAEATIVATSHDLRNQAGVWWDTTWEIRSGPVELTVTGSEGPPHLVDECIEFARAVARSAGCQVATPQKQAT